MFLPPKYWKTASFPILNERSGASNGVFPLVALSAGAVEYADCTSDIYQPHIPKEVKIGYCLERVEQYVPAPLRYFKC